MIRTTQVESLRVRAISSAVAVSFPEATDLHHPHTVLAGESISFKDLGNELGFHRQPLSATGRAPRPKSSVPPAILPHLRGLCSHGLHVAPSIVRLRELDGGRLLTELGGFEHLRFVVGHRTELVVD